jgi:hypothetical protein
VSTSLDGSTAVCVLGMSRSGTSLTARVLELAGVYLGSEDDLLGGELSQIPAEDRGRAGEANPEGFWEHYRLMRLNERILRHLGGSWREPPELPSGWETSAELGEEREEALSLIDKTFAGRDLWGWKDPRNALTLPFWQRLLPGLRHVICLRNPLDVALSLQERDGMPIERGLELWHAYADASLTHTADRPRTLVSYEAYFDDAEAIATRLARFVGREDAFATAGAMQSLHRAVDRRLWRQSTALKTGRGGDRMPAEVVDLYRFATRLASELSIPPPIQSRPPASPE